MESRRPFDDIEVQLVNAIEDAANVCANNTELKMSNGFWTTDMKRAFAHLAKRSGYNQRCSETNREFLWDITWMTVQEQIWRVFMSCEMEWSNNFEEILYDFRKLSMSVAPFRVMVFDRSNKNVFDEVVQRLIEAIPDGDSGKYLFVGVKSMKDPSDSRMVMSVGW